MQRSAVIPKTIIKRDGIQVPFDRLRIASAIQRAQSAIGHEDTELAEELSHVVVQYLERSQDSESVDLEMVQDAVIHVLQESGNYEVALAYTRYRDARERERRHRRLSGSEPAAPNLQVVDRRGAAHRWDRTILTTWIQQQLGLTAKVAVDVVLRVEAMLADSDLTEIHGPLLLSLVDAALVCSGHQRIAGERCPLRLDRETVRRLIDKALHGAQVVEAIGREALLQDGLVSRLPSECQRAWASGRLWIDGLDDPLRGSQFTATVDGFSNPFQVVAESYALAAESSKYWRRVTLILPPSVLGSLERGASGLIHPLDKLSLLAEVFLYCDGRTALLDQWPLLNKRIGLATYSEDFLLLRRLQELNLRYLNGPHLMQGGYRRRMGVILALNAQGLDDEFSQLDLQALALVSAARYRRCSLDHFSELAGADLGFAVFGLPPGSRSLDYIERQVVQEALRAGLALARTSQVPEDACEHLSRLMR